jgi:hypothetical protein
MKLLAVALLVACTSHDHDNQRQPTPPPTPTPTPAPVATPSATPAAPAAPAAAAPSQPCSKISAAEVTAIVGFPVTAQDEGYRCKFVDAKNGWLQVELMPWSSRSAHDICAYGGDKRTVVPGVGDEAAYFGATACVKRGDVAIVVDATNLSVDSPAMHSRGAGTVQIRVAQLVATRIP